LLLPSPLERGRVRKKPLTMTFQNKGLTYFVRLEHRGIASLRLRMGYMDAKEDIWELTFDI
jgi:hypothetical protein